MMIDAALPPRGGVFVLYGESAVALSALHGLGHAAALGEELVVGIVADASWDPAVEPPVLADEERRTLVERLPLVSDVRVVDLRDDRSAEDLVAALQREGVERVASLGPAGPGAAAVQHRLLLAAVDAGLPVHLAV